ncbi:MAG TPA: hypothetical protein VGJ07_21075 [Rugosimonospora sp.]
MSTSTDHRRKVACRRSNGMGGNLVAVPGTGGAGTAFGVSAGTAFGTD